MPVLELYIGYIHGPDLIWQKYELATQQIWIDFMLFIPLGQIRFWVYGIYTPNGHKFPHVHKLKVES